MKHPFRLGLLVSTLAAVWLAGCTTPPPATEPAGEVTLKLQLPESQEFPGRKKRVAKLTIDDKDYPATKDAKRTLTVPLKANQSTVTMHYVFWTDKARVERTRTLKVEKGKEYAVDLTRADSDHADKEDALDVTLNLSLPGSQEYPIRDRGARLTIDGQDHTAKLGANGKKFAGPKEITLKVPFDEDKNAVTIVYGFWTNNYTNFIRTKVVPVEMGKIQFVDMTREDPKNKDHIEPLYIPTPKAAVAEMLKLGKVGKDDVVWDIGCGDGRLVIMAVEEFGAKSGLGIDIDPKRIAESKLNQKKSKLAKRMEFKEGNALEIKSVAEATVVLLYMGDDLNLRIRPMLRETLQPGARLVSHRFTMGDWKPDETRKITVKNDDNEDEEFELHLWVIKGKKK